MAEQFTLPNGAGGLKIASDGTRYGADPTGHITVENPDHVKQIREKGSLYITKRITGFGHLAIERCNCGFAPFKFSSVCPRCGNTLK